MNVRCLIVDDEPPAVNELDYILSKIEGIQVIDKAGSAGGAIRAIRSKQPDLVFLDIKMPGRDGFEVIKACVSYPKTPYFIFATAYDEHALQAFEASAVDYILKPFQADRVLAGVERVRQLMASRRQGALCGQLEKLVDRIKPRASSITKVSVEHKGRILLLDPEDIVYARAKDKGVMVCTNERCYGIHGMPSLDALASRVSEYGFFRSHRSFLVNLAHVSEVVPWFNGKYLLTIRDRAATEVPVSRRRVKALKRRLGI
ncbi:MAG: LytTR family DNA-binding domain-containing protein [Desulfobacteraceae bacterium]